MQGSFGALVLAAVAAGGFFLLRRYLPPVSCPQCGSSSWIILGDMKACRDCGRLFH